MASHGCVEDMVFFAGLMRGSRLVCYVDICMQMWKSKIVSPIYNRIFVLVKAVANNYSNWIVNLASHVFWFRRFLYYSILVLHNSSDHERVINYHIQQGCYKEVLKVLTASVGSAHLFYKFSPLLMQHIPTATVDAWIEKGKGLEPKRLIPSLIQCNQPAATESHQVYIYHGDVCHGLMVMWSKIN